MAKELMGKDTLYLQDAGSISCVRELKESLKSQFPELNKLPGMAIAVNVDYAQDDDKVQAQDEIVIIPPVSGG